VQLDWTAVPGATGYRILRAGGDGTEVVVADLDVVTGDATAAPDVVGVWSDAHGYVPAGAPLAAADGSTAFHLVDVGAAAPRCYRVVAHGPGGDATPSATACVSPP
jgi:hypothetical protein